LRAFAFLRASKSGHHLLSLAIVRGFVVSGGPKMGKEVVTTAAGFSLGAETAKAAPVAAAVVIGGITAVDWAYLFAAGYSILLSIHFVMSKWVIPLFRYVRAQRRKARGVA
jgi:hypothetical protein